MKQWAYATLHNSPTLIKSVSLGMLYDALGRSYELGDLDFVCILTEAIKDRLQ